MNHSIVYKAGLQVGDKAKPKVKENKSLPRSALSRMLNALKWQRKTHKHKAAMMIQNKYKVYRARMAFVKAVHERYNELARGPTMTIQRCWRIFIAQRKMKYYALLAHLHNSCRSNGVAISQTCQSSALYHT